MASGQSRVAACEDHDPWEIIESEEAPLGERINPSDQLTKPLCSLEISVRIGEQPRTGDPTPSAIQTGDSPSSKDRVHRLQEYRYQAQCRLFALPVELRLRIYELVLHLNQPRVQLHWHPSTNESRRPSVLSLLQTCRRIHSEAESIFYSMNHFQFPFKGPARAEEFCRSISPRRQDAIQVVTVFISSAGAALATIEELAILPKLKKISLERQHSIRFTDTVAWAVFAKHLRAALESVPSLKELEIHTPEAEAVLNWREEDNKKRLDGIDESLLDVVSRKNFGCV